MFWCYEDKGRTRWLRESWGLKVDYRKFRSDRSRWLSMLNFEMTLVEEKQIKLETLNHVSCHGWNHDHHADIERPLIFESPRFSCWLGWGRQLSITQIRVPQASILRCDCWSSWWSIFSPTRIPTFFLIFPLNLRVTELLWKWFFHGIFSDLVDNVG